MKYVLHTTMSVTFHSFQPDQKTWQKSKKEFFVVCPYILLWILIVFYKHTGNSHSSHFSCLWLSRRAWTRTRESWFMSCLWIQGKNKRAELVRLLIWPGELNTYWEFLTKDREEDCSWHKQCQFVNFFLPCLWFLHPKKWIKKL